MGHLPQRQARDPLLVRTVLAAKLATGMVDGGADGREAKGVDFAASADVFDAGLLSGTVALAAAASNDVGMPTRVSLTTLLTTES